MKNYISDMDGVLIKGQEIIPGADKFIERLKEKKAKFLVLTNNSLYTARDLAHSLRMKGLDVNENQIFTSAIATAQFLNSQRPNGTAFVIGEVGLSAAIHEIGYVITDKDPDYVVLGETNSYNQELITKAIRLINQGARFIATNPDTTGPTEAGIVPGCGAMAALIKSATRINPMFVGKPNPLMMRSALNYLGVHSENTIMIGDRMNTDIIAGVQSGMETILVLSGITGPKDINKYPYVPTTIVDSVADIVIKEKDED